MKKSIKIGKDGYYFWKTGIFKTREEMIEYLVSLVDKFPSLIVSCFGVLMALLFWITGIILEVIAKKHKQDYELYLNLLRKNK